MFYSFEVWISDGEDEWWQPITLANIHQVEAYLARPTKIRKFKGWSNE